MTAAVWLLVAVVALFGLALLAGSLMSVALGRAVSGYEELKEEEREEMLEAQSEKRDPGFRIFNGGQSLPGDTGRLGTAVAKKEEADANDNSATERNRRRSDTRRAG